MKKKYINKKNLTKDNNKRVMDLNGKSNYIFSFYFILNFDYIFFILIIINKKMKYFNNK